MPTLFSRLALLLALVLAACAAPEASPTPTTAPVVLRILNWDTYIDPDLLDRFAAETGVRVEYSTYASNEELLAMVQAAPNSYDLVVPGDYMVPIMRRAGLLAPLNKANLPNLANLDPLFVSPAYDPANRHCVPYLWGTMGIGYNIAATGRPITRWADVFEPEFAGRVALLDGERYILGLTLLGLGHSPNSTDPDEIAAARDFLRAHRDQIAALAPDDGQERLRRGEVDLAFEWSGDMLQVMAENPNLRYAIPAEGSIIWTDNMCVLAGSPNQELAERFINFILEPEIGAALANYTRYSTPNRAALALIDPADRANPTLYPDDETRKRLFFLVDVGSEGAALYARAWRELSR